LYNPCFLIENAIFWVRFVISGFRLGSASGVKKLGPERHAAGGRLALSSFGGFRFAQFFGV